MARSTTRTRKTGKAEPKTAAERRPRGKSRTEAAPVRRPKGGKARANAEGGAPARARRQSKQQACLDLLARPEGASIADLRQATGWQAHSVRGFLSGVVSRKLGLRLASDMGKDGVRRYRIAGDR